MVDCRPTYRPSGGFEITNNKYPFFIPKMDKDVKNCR
jgi:hypothetical protein